jgi:hypothetical protein
MQIEDDPVIGIINKLRSDFRNKRDEITREEGKLGQIKKSFLQEVDTDNIDEIKLILEELVNKMTAKKKEMDFDLKELREFYAI